MESGLTSAQVLEKIHTFGKNEIIIEKRFTILSLLFSQFPTFINGILFLASLFSFIINDITDGILILAIILINAIFGFFQEYKAEKSLEKLKKLTSFVSRVIRNDKEQQISTIGIVPEDIIIITEGEYIPADGIVITQPEIEVDESLLTGESLPIGKKYKDEVYKGTLLIRGHCRIKVTNIGIQTRLGQIAKILESIEIEKTPLEIRLITLGKIISVIVMLISFLLIPLGIIRHNDIESLILLSISIGVAAIPEGLPSVITVALAIGTNNMAKKNTIVRKMAAIETLGNIQILLIDKTGTLTQNIMRVKEYWAPKKEYLSYIMYACVLGNTSSLIEKGKTGEFDTLGDKTDGALLFWAKKMGTDTEYLKNNGEIIDEFIFDSLTRTVTTVFINKGEINVFVRGAPEAILSKSIISDEEKLKITDKFNSYAIKGLRIIGFGTKIIKEKTKKRDDLENNLIFLGFVCIYDPPRIEASATVLQAKQAGITTIMVTGDSKITALAIAKEIGLIENDEDIITGAELEKISDIELEKILPRIRVFARTKPEDKLRLVSVYKNLGYVVGVTGDGVNDSLALKKADVGIAMGVTGTDVAKEASDIILVDDNFNTLIEAVEEGRHIYNNIIKAVIYLLANNLSELSLILFGVILGIPSPLLPVQILWINIVSDGLPALALASDTKNIGLLMQKPRNPKEPILSKKNIINISILGFSIAIFLLGVFLLLLRNGSEDFARTCIFNLLVICHLFLAYIIRGKKGKEINFFLLYATIGTIVMQILITLTPFTREIFHLAW